MLVTVTKETTCVEALVPQKLCALNENRHFLTDAFGMATAKKRELLPLV
jgi:hypothetical protein